MLRLGRYSMAPGECLLSSSSASRSARPWSLGGHILIVDDDLGTRELFSLILRRHGFAATAAPGLGPALSVLAKQPVDLVLLDRRLGSEDGLKLLRLTQGRRAGVRAILVTAFGDVPSTVEAMRLGALDVVEKPLDEPHLLAIADRYVGDFKHARPLLEPAALLRAMAEDLEIPTFLDLAASFRAVADCASDRPEAHAASRARRLVSRRTAGAIRQPDR